MTDVNNHAVKKKVSVIWMCFDMLRSHVTLLTTLIEHSIGQIIYLQLLSLVY